MFHARVVVDIVSDAVTTGELEDVRTQLADSYESLFELADAEGEPVAEEQRPH